jgi:16S rRNA processing protein RimM
MMIYGEPIEDDEALWIHKLIGSSVLDQDGIDRGVVIEVIENPASDLLSLASGALVPLVFVSRFDAASSKIYIEAPEGLFVDYPSSSEPQG